jgi:hypothetical protein
MPAYDTLLSDALVEHIAEIDWPEGMRLVGPADGPSPTGAQRFRIEDDNAPDWTEGQLVTPTLLTEYEVNSAGYPTGNVAKVIVSGWRVETCVS